MTDTISDGLGPAICWPRISIRLRASCRIYVGFKESDGRLLHRRPRVIPIRVQTEAL